MAPKSVASKVIVTDEGRRQRELAQALGIDGYGDTERLALRDQLAQQERNYRAGERGALALGIKICGLLGEPLPPWIAAVWARACTEIATRKLASWDQVLGNDPPKSEKGRRHGQIERERLGKLSEVMSFLRGVPIRKGDPEGSFFWFIARHLDINPAAARKLYYKLPSQHRPSKGKRAG